MENFQNEVLSFSPSIYIYIHIRFVSKQAPSISQPQIRQVAPSGCGAGAGVPAPFPLSFFALWPLHMHGLLPESAENMGKKKLMCHDVPNCRGETFMPVLPHSSGTVYQLVQASCEQTNILGVSSSFTLPPTCSKANSSMLLRCFDGGRSVHTKIRSTEMALGTYHKNDATLSQLLIAPSLTSSCVKQESG